MSSPHYHKVLVKRPILDPVHPNNHDSKDSANHLSNQIHASFPNQIGGGKRVLLRRKDPASISLSTEKGFLSSISLNHDMNHNVNHDSLLPSHIVPTLQTQSSALFISTEIQNNQFEKISKYHDSSSVQPRGLLKETISVPISYSILGPVTEFVELKRKQQKQLRQQAKLLAQHNCLEHVFQSGAKAVWLVIVEIEEFSNFIIR